MLWSGLQIVIVVFPDIIDLFFWVFYQALHQATRLDKLLQLFPVHGIEDAIAKYVFDKFVEKMDMVMSLIILTQNDSYTFHAMILLC